MLHGSVVYLAVLCCFVGLITGVLFGIFPGGLFPSIGRTCSFFTAPGHCCVLFFFFFYCFYFFRSFFLFFLCFILFFLCRLIFGVITTCIVYLVLVWYWILLFFCVV